MTTEKQKEKNRKQYTKYFGKEGSYRILTKKDIASFTQAEKELWEIAKKNNNIIAGRKLEDYMWKFTDTRVGRKGTHKDRGFGHVAMFDSDSYKKVYPHVQFPKSKIQSKIDKESLKNDPSGRLYRTEIGVHLPKKKPLTPTQKAALRKLIDSGKYEDPLQSKEGQEILNMYKKNKGGSVGYTQRWANARRG